MLARRECALGRVRACDCVSARVQMYAIIQLLSSSVCFVSTHPVHVPGDGCTGTGASLSLEINFIIIFINSDTFSEKRSG